MSAINRSHEDYVIAWICALPLEMTAAISMLDELHDQLPQLASDENTYTLGKICGQNVVVASLPAGIAAISQMRSTFPNIRFGLVVGIGGGVPSEKNDIRLGDVVVSKPSGTSGVGWPRVESRDSRAGPG
jgi:nucleoside phosphorylase